MTVPLGPGVRLDTGVYEGFEVPIHYDPLLAKLIVWAESREEALRRMRRAVAEYRVVGIKTTLPFFARVLSHPAFASGDFDTSFVDVVLGAANGRPGRRVDLAGRCRRDPRLRGAANPTGRRPKHKPPSVACGRPAQNPRRTPEKPKMIFDATVAGRTVRVEVRAGTGATVALDGVPMEVDLVETAPPSRASSWAGRATRSPSRSGRRATSCTSRPTRSPWSWRIRREERSPRLPGPTARPASSPPCPGGW
jgi:hypothetical protein